MQPGKWIYTLYPDFEQMLELSLTKEVYSFRICLCKKVMLGIQCFFELQM